MVQTEGNSKVIRTGHRRPPLPEGRASSELEQIASSLPGEVTKSGQRSTRRTAATALDNRRLRRSLGVRDLDGHAATGVANELELWIVEHGGPSLRTVVAPEVRSVKHVLAPFVRLDDESCWVRSFDLTRTLPVGFVSDRWIDPVTRLRLRA